jgi:hypothetical protein
LNELKEFEEGKRVLSPSIFRKSKGPIILSASAAGFISQISASQNLEGTQKTISQGTFKKPEASAIVKDVSLVEYDINSCMDLKDMHCKQQISKAKSMYRVNLQVLRQLFKHGFTAVFWPSHNLKRRKRR